MLLSASPTATLLHDTGRVAALYQPGGEGLIVSLAPRQAERAIWGRAFLARLGASLLGLVDHRDSWFPEEDMALLSPRLEPLLAAHRRVVLYGFSMGAYAALKHAARLRADVVLAFAPQYSISPADVGAFDPRRSQAFFQAALHTGMRLRPGDLRGQALLFHDPLFPEDARHAALIRAAGPVVTVPTPFANHDSLRFVLQAGALAPLLRAALEGPVDIAALRHGLRQGRLLSADYVENLAAALRRRRGEAAAARLVRQAIEAGNTAPGLRIERAHRLLDEASEAAAEALLDGLDEGSLPPPQAAALTEARRRLRLRRGEDRADPPDFPAGDPLWEDAAGFLLERVLPRDRILAPALFAARLPDIIPYARPPGDGAEAWDWVVVSKERLPALGGAFLRNLAATATPVFANALFVIWARQPSFGLVDRRDTPEVAALLRDLRDTGAGPAADPGSANPF
ncbi:hypothetical protein [Roseomonas sp. KE0001]|uniref:hypothetical protein n=1 Tax=Roseomonas sp. KE0001 TaxID=2479201 RepID=UPI0018DFC5E1|nr:hypothetical protein [Roseomonas sp. KE0001]MBI0434058.1 hypothetical protein [Roseomonas sp. KE0001]